jgi:hypothetical protein
VKVIRLNHVTKRLRSRRGDPVRGSTLLSLLWEQEMFVSLKIPSQCPLVLLVKVGRRKGKSVRSEEVMSVGVASGREFDCLGFGLCLKVAVTVWSVAPYTGVLIRP